METDLDKHIEETKQLTKEFVHKSLFDAVLLELKENLSELKVSMKELLQLVHEQSKH